MITHMFLWLVNQTFDYSMIEWLSCTMLYWLYIHVYISCGSTCAVINILNFRHCEVGFHPPNLNDIYCASLRYSC